MRKLGSVFSDRGTRGSVEDGADPLGSDPPPRPRFPGLMFPGICAECSPRVTRAGDRGAWGVRGGEWGGFPSPGSGCSGLRLPRGWSLRSQVLVAPRAVPVWGVWCTGGQTGGARGSS